MATPAQCYYCFESLDAAFKRKEPPSLAIVEDLWEQHERFKLKKTLEIEDDDDDDNAAEGSVASAKSEDSRPSLSLLGVSRLHRDTLSPASSHPSRTPSSTLSTNSSRSALTTSTTVTTPSEQPEQRYPLFVTWNTISKHGQKSLRGCIGTFEPHELSKGLREYALTSAFEDTRFSPIPASLLPSLSCHITLLSHFEPCAHALDWDLGTHGLRISFIYRNRRYGATYLPDVAVEQGWTKEETVESLMRKAGWDRSGSHSSSRKLLRGGSSRSGHKTWPWEEVEDFQATRYQGLGATASYKEWMEWREWVAQEESRAKLLE
ncbi:hypothetical protein VTN31DRAFT_3985 [Thermomyces dupontii]|uniref:uncharacterized protein n=1 Tax=Talaromyces thermophilus TaxID=28565 RepID=UPI003743C294